MKTTPIKVRKLGHFVYEVSDIERSTEFWTDIMGFSVSDRNELGMVFLRTASDHHAVALIPSKKATRPPADAGLAFNHLALEVDDIGRGSKISRLSCWEISSFVSLSLLNS